MEGDFASGCVMLAEYTRVITSLEDIRKTCHFTSLVKMIDVMLPKICGYQEEATHCETIIMATILNPRLRLKFFHLHYPTILSDAQDLIEHHFQKSLEDWTNTPPPSPSKSRVSSSNHPKDQFDLFSASDNISSGASLREVELVRYLEGQASVLADQSPLDWWNVSFTSRLLV